MNESANERGSVCNKAMGTMLSVGAAAIGVGTGALMMRKAVKGTMGMTKRQLAKAGKAASKAGSAVADTASSAASGGIGKYAKMNTKDIASSAVADTASSVASGNIGKYARMNTKDIKYAASEYASSGNIGKYARMNTNDIKPSSSSKSISDYAKMNTESINSGISSVKSGTRPSPSVSGFSKMDVSGYTMPAVVNKPKVKSYGGVLPGPVQTGSGTVIHGSGPVRKPTAGNLSGPTVGLLNGPVQAGPGTTIHL